MRSEFESGENRGDAFIRQVAAPGLIVDPVEREAFKRRGLGIRGDLRGAPFVQLQRGPWNDQAARGFAERRSHRSYSPEPVGFGVLSAWLGDLRQVELGDGPKRRYGSAGNAYPVQVYLQVAPDRVEGLGPGTYYHHPVDHRLIPLTELEELDGEVHFLANRVMAQQAAFWVFLVAELDAIRPLYGKKARDFALIEAGLISQLLETAAAEHGLGLCQVGVVDVDALRPRLKLGDSQELLHCLVGGQRTATQPARTIEPPVASAMPWNPGAPPALARPPDESAREVRPPAPVDPAQVAAIQDKLIRIWKETLGTRSVDVHETFFDIGGNSLQAAQAMRRLQEQVPVRIEVADLFSYPTIAELSIFLARKLAGSAATPPAVPPPAPARAPEGTAVQQEPSIPEPARATTPPEPGSEPAPLPGRADAVSMAPVSTPAATVPGPLPSPEPSRAPVGATPPSAIAIVGVAGRLPDAPDCATFWENLRAGVCSVGPLPPERAELVPEFQLRPAREFQGSYLRDIELFDPLFFRLSPKETARMDPVQRLLLQISHEVVERAGYMGGQLAGTRTAVLVGGGASGYWEIPQVDIRNADLAKVLSGNMSAILANRISHFLDLRGPSLAVDTACSSSLVAVDLACRMLLSGDAEMALVASANLSLIPKAYEALRQDGMAAAGGQCRTFDARADGFVRGEGAAAVLLKPLEAALRDGDTIHAIIRGSATNHDGRTNSLSVPNPRTQCEVIELAHRRAGISPDRLSYVEAHGTGTALGDPIEVKGLTMAFGACTARRGFCGIGSLKSNLGHLEYAAGLAGMVKVILAMQNRELPPSLHFGTPNPHIDFTESPFYVVDRLRPWESDGPRLAAVSSFGFGGSNAHLVLEEAPRSAVETSEERPAHVLALSARNAEGLRRLVKSFLHHLNGDAEADLRAVCFSANTGRAQRAHRLAVVARTRDELVSKLELFSMAQGDRELQGALVFSGALRDDGGLPTPVRRRVGARAQRLPPAAVRTLLSWCRGHAVNEIRRHLGPLAAGTPLDGGADALGLGREGWIDLLAVLAELYTAGAEVSWGALDAGLPPRRVPLPPSPLELQRCWWPAELLPRASTPPEVMQRASTPVGAGVAVGPTAGEDAPPPSVHAGTPVPSPTPPPATAEPGGAPPDPVAGPPQAGITVTPAATLAVAPIPAAPTPPAPERTPATVQELTELIVNGVGLALGIPSEQVEVRQPLFEMGMDSIQGVRLIRALEERTGTQFQPTLFFENPTIEALATTLVRDYQVSLLTPAANALAPTQARPAPVQAQPVQPTPIPVQPAPAAPPPVSAPALPAPARALPSTVQAANADPGRDIAVIGMAGRFPGAQDVEQFWELLRAGGCTVTEIPRERWDVASRYDPNPDSVGRTYAKWGGFLPDILSFDPLFFRISDREAEWMDPQQRLLLEVAWDAIESAGYAGDALSGTATGVFIGATYTHTKDQLLHLLPFLPDAHAGMGTQNALLANRISYFLNLRGPSLIVDTLCSSSLVAVHLAVQSLRRGECDQALVGGVHVGMSARYYEALSRLRAASPTGLCRTFDRDADGYVPGEGVAAVLLKPLAKALADGDHVLGVIRGTAMNHGGQASGLAVPNPAAQAEVVSAALRDAGVSGRSLTYLEAHGTGTSLGDPIELTGLRRALGQETRDRQFCAVGSVKTNIGHLEPAAGIAGLIKVLLALRAREIPPTLHVRAPTPKFEFEESPCYIADRVRPWLPHEGVRRAGVSSFGLGGVNAHTIVEEAPSVPRERPAVDRPVHLFVLSARSPQALRRLAEAHAAHLARSPDDIRDVCFTACAGRAHFRHRLACVVASKEELRERLLSAWSASPAGAVLLSPETRTPPPGWLARIDATLEQLPEQARSALARWCRGAVAQERLRRWSAAGQPLPAPIDLPPESWRGLLETVGRLYVVGADVGWREVHAGLVRWRVGLPTYPFERRLCRAEVPVEGRPANLIASMARNIALVAAPVDPHPLLQSAAPHENGTAGFEFHLRLDD